MNLFSHRNLNRAQKESHVTRDSLGRFISSPAALLLVIALAVIARVASALYLGNQVQDLPGIYDQMSYDALARRVAGGAGFSFAGAHWPLTQGGAPTAHWSYLYTLYLAAVYFVSGSSPLLARVLQAVIVGILHCWLVWRIGRRIVSAPVGLAAALLSAVYLYFVYYAGALMTESFYFVGILWTLDCAMRLAAPPDSEERVHGLPRAKWRLWLELGLAIGFTALLRQVFLLFVPFLFLWLWWICLHRVRQEGSYRWHMVRMWLWGSILSIVVIVTLIVPWTMRNYRAFDTFVLLNTNSGYAFFWGNHPIYGTHFVGILPGDGPSYQDLVPVELRQLNEAELDRALLKEGMKFVFDDPVRYVLLSLSRTREYFKFWPSEESSTISNLARVGSFGVLLPLILYGLWVSAVLAWKTEAFSIRAMVVLLGLFCMVYTGLHLLTWALIRYRLPVDAVLLIVAAVGAADLAQRYLSLSRNVVGRPTTLVEGSVYEPHRTGQDTAGV